MGCTKNVRNKVFKRTLHEYASASSAHGIAYILEPDRMIIERLFWILVVGLAFCYSIYSTYHSYNDWKDSPVITTVNSAAYPIKMVEFPKITICSQGGTRDVMDVVLVRQFEEFLRSIGTQSKENKNLASGKTKIRAKQNIVFTLSDEELKEYAFGFLKAIYSGASGSPVDMVQMMSLPEINPDSLILALNLLNPKQSNCKHIGSGITTKQDLEHSKVIGRKLACIFNGHDISMSKAKAKFDNNQNQKNEDANSNITTPSKVTTGIKTLNLLLDPSKASKLHKTVQTAKEKWQKNYGSLNISKAYEKLFELLWYSRLPCFDVKNITSEVRDEMSLIKRCYWRNQLIDCASVFTTHLTDRGVCCAFNAENAEKIYKKSAYSIELDRLQGYAKSKSFPGLPKGYVNPLNMDEGPKIHSGRGEGLQLVVDAHDDKISYGSVADNIRGIYVVIDGREKYPFTSSNGILLKTGQNNEIAITPTYFEADPKVKSIPPIKRNCYFPDEQELEVYSQYSQANCILECEMNYVRRKLLKETGMNCTPWFYPRSNRSLYDICDPWMTWKFQIEQKIAPDNANECFACLMDCSATKYKSSVSSAPFRDCDQKNIGVSLLCDFTEPDPRLIMMNPSIWKNEVEGEYEKFNGGKIPEFVDNAPGMLSNIRYFVPKQEVKNVVLRSQREEKPTYNAFDRDITLVNFYFPESKIIQFETDLRMTTIDFISTVGGLWGLFWGVSITTIIEFVYWATIRLMGNCFRDT